MTSGRYTPNRIKVFKNRAMVYLNGSTEAVSLIDCDDVQRVRDAQPWIFSANNGYACAPLRIGSKKTTMLMHRFIIDAPKGSVVDHINRNRLDNRKTNLRISNKCQNNYNSTAKGDDVGVGWHKKSSRWRAYITKDGRQHHLGHFCDRESALKARRAAEIEMYGVKRPRKETDRC